MRNGHSVTCYTDVARVCCDIEKHLERAICVCIK